MVICPLCEIEMREVSVRANPGTLIILDQCRRCGGVWCDKWELFPVDPEEAKRVDALDEKLLRSPTTAHEKALYCPRCRDRLRVFNDPLLPPDIQLQRCRRCEGIWLNKGQFSRFKSFQKKRKAERLGQPENMDKLFDAYRNPTSWVTIGTRGIFAYPRGEPEADEANAITLSSAVRLVLHALLRLMLPF